MLNYITFTIFNRYNVTMILILCKTCILLINVGSGAYSTELHNDLHMPSFKTHGLLFHANEM